MLKAKETGLGIEEVEIPTYLVEVRKKDREDAHHSLLVDLTHVTSSNGVVNSVDEVG